MKIDTDNAIDLEAICAELNNLLTTNHKQGQVLAQKAIDIASQRKNYYYIARAQRFKGLFLLLQGQADDALEHLKVALNITKTHHPNDYELIAFCFRNIGAVYIYKENFELALDYSLRTLAFETFLNTSITHSNIGMCYERMKNFNKAIEHYNIGLSIAKKKENTRRIILLSYNIAYTNYVTGDIKAAHKKVKDVLLLLNKHKKDATKLNQLSIYAQSLEAWTTIKLDDVEKGLKKLEIAIELSEQFSYYMVQNNNLNEKADICFAIGQEKEAVASLKRALKCVQNINLRYEEKKTLKRLVEYYQNKEDYKNAFFYLNQLQELSQLQFKESRDKNLKKIVEDRENEIQLLEKKNIEIQEHNKILEQFARITAHDLREPVRGITGFTGLLQKEAAGILNKKGNDYLNFILSETKSMNNKLSQLLKYTTLKRSAKGEIKLIELPKVIANIESEHNNLSINLNINQENKHWKISDHHLFTLFQELIKNASQFRKKETTCLVEIDCKTIVNHYKITVKDYGIGIDTKYHEKVFKIFSRLNRSENERAGVGLAICERIVQLYKGKIWLESKLDEFTIVHIQIPIYS